jgi:intracellular multiplication protein IcmT
MDIHWRNTQKQVRFFFIDARGFFGFFLFLVHARPWTFVVAVVMLTFFWFLERKGLTFESSLRAFRSWILGANRPANSRRARRRLVDFEGR